MTVLNIVIANEKMQQSYPTENALKISSPMHCFSQREKMQEDSEGSLRMRKVR